jgi:mxaK protein
MAMSYKRGLTVGVSIALALSLAGLALSAHALYQRHALNALITQGAAAKIDDEAPPRALFAKAYQLRQAGKLEAALELYHRLEQVADREIKVRANYNIGNIYVTQAQIDAQLLRLKNIGTLVGIARSQYQRALRLDSDFFDAKYNLEYTRFLVTERDSDQQEYEGGLSRQHQSKRDWAEFQQLPQGLP